MLINEKAINWGDSPTIFDGRTLVPMRALFEAPETRISCDQAKREDTASKDGTEIVIRANGSRGERGIKTVHSFAGRLYQKSKRFRLLECSVFHRAERVSTEG
ncbi:MAG: stalk domain-containing protein [Bacillota bacterium]